MSEPKVVSMSVRPYQVSHLSFEVGGILEASVALLGAPVKAFDFPLFYSALATLPTVAGDPSRLLYNYADIDAAVLTHALVTLRKEARKAALNNAINARQNAYFAKYGNSAAIVAQMRDFYGPNTAPSLPTATKPQRLQTLANIATDQWNLLKTTYTSDPTRNPGGTSGGVVKTTNSVLCSDTSSYGYSATSGVANELSVSSSDVNIPKGSPGPPNPPGPWAPPTWPAPCQSSGGRDGDPLYGQGGGAGGGALPAPQPPPAATDTWEEAFGGGSGTTADSIQKTTTYQTSSNADLARQSQTIINTDYGFRVPYYEAQAQYERAQISLMDQQFAQFMYGQNLQNLTTVFKNELNSIDSNVYRLQVAYADTILMSPIAGVVTGIYKNPGDAVKAGEPVVRVEDNRTIYLIAKVIHRGPIAICPPPPLPQPQYSSATVKTTLYGVPGALTTIPGVVVSARGHYADDTWDLVVKCTNPLDAAGNPTFPLGYSFDYDDTTISIV